MSNYPLATSTWDEEELKAIEEARKLCIECPSTYRILRNQDLICIVRQNGIIWINASPEIMGLNKQEETAAAAAARRARAPSSRL